MLRSLRGFKVDFRVSYNVPFKRSGVEGSKQTIDLETNLMDLADLILLLAQLEGN